MSLLPDRSSRILGLATATVLGLPAQPWQPGRTDTVIVAYDLRGLDAEHLGRPRDRATGSILVEHATATETDEPAPGDADADLQSFAGAVARAWPWADSRPDRMWSPDPVPSAYFT